MADATQKLIDEARAWQGIYGDDLVMRLADALEAAQRPPVSGDYTHVVNLARASEAADKGFDALVNYLADLPTIEEWRPPVSPEVLTDVLMEVTTWPRPSAHRLASDILARLSVHERPPVTPEQREAVANVVSSAMIRAKTDTPYGVTDAILARFSVPSQPVYDEEKIAKVLIRASREFHGEYGACIDEVDAPFLASALVAALRGGELTQEEDDRG